MLYAIYRKFRQRPGRDHNSLAAALPERREVLLPVVSQHFIACLGNPGAILLEAGQNYQITLVYDWTAEALNIA